jgi:hypothetical protein
VIRLNAETGNWIVSDVWRAPFDLTLKG